MNQFIADFVRDKCRVVAVSDSYRLAPWAEALVSNDCTWWHKHKDALRFAGRKFCAHWLDGTERIPYHPQWGTRSNSGLQGMRVAKLLGASLILLCGFDLSDAHGAHFFGEHPEGLKKSSAKDFKRHIQQFNDWQAPAVINCTPGSALRRFPIGNIYEVLCP